MIPIPDSVAFYWGDAVNRAAVNVLAGNTEVPGDLTLAEAGRFELAALAARRVRVEYWGMLRALWSASWDEAVRRHLPSARLLTHGGHLAFSRETEALAHPSVDHGWHERAASGVYDIAGYGRLFTRLALVENEREGELRFYLIDADQSCTITDGMELPHGWSDDGDSRRMTTPGLLPLSRHKGRLDPEPFAALALGAVTALAAALP